MQLQYPVIHGQQLWHQGASPGRLWVPRPARSGRLGIASL